MTNMLSHPKVFLAHSARDKPIVREFYYLLREDGFDPWLDEECLIPGQDWELEVKRMIGRAHVVLVFLSHNSVNSSGYIQKELVLSLDVAQKQPEGQIFIVPIRMNDCNVPERLAHLHYLVLSDTAGDIARAYLSIQMTLIHRALEIGLLTMDELMLRRYGYESFKSTRRRTFLDEYLTGPFLVRGRTPDGAIYYGRADIKLIDPKTCKMTAKIGSQRFSYRGHLDGQYLKFSGDHDVCYAINHPRRILVGEWDQGGVEELIPASPFSYIKVSPNTKANESVDSDHQ